MANLFIILNDTLVVDLSGKTTTHMYIIPVIVVVLFVLIIRGFSKKDKNNARPGKNR